MSDYEVGYGKPPRHSQFKKGHSGNPHRKKKPGEIDLPMLLRSILNEKVTIAENSQPVRLTRMQIILRQLRRKALLNDPRACRLMLGLLDRAAMPPEDPLQFGTKIRAALEEIERVYGPPSPLPRK